MSQKKEITKDEPDYTRYGLIRDLQRKDFLFLLRWMAAVQSLPGVTSSAKFTAIRLEQVFKNEIRRIDVSPKVSA